MLPDTLTYSGGDVTKMQVIGKVKTTPLQLIDSEGEETEMPSAEYQIVEIVETSRGKIYIANLWYKEHKRIPQILHENLVEQFIKA